AQLQQRAGAGGGGDVRRPLDEDLPLAAGRVVLLQPGDLLEEGAAALVVEPFRRQGLGRAGQPLVDVLAERLGEVVGGEEAVHVAVSFRGGRRRRRTRARR